jgi:hypothetical protein
VITGAGFMAALASKRTDEHDTPAQAGLSPRNPIVKKAPLEAGLPWRAPPYRRRMSI